MSVPPPVQARAGLLKLPVFRPVALKILRLVANDQVEVQNVAGLLRADPGLSAQVLAVANSALYGNARHIDNLSRAILVLGFERTKALTLTVALKSFLRYPGKIRRMENCWQHSLATALIAEDLAPIFGLGKDEAYISALIHDVGRLGLLMAFRDWYVPLLDAPHESVRACLESERSLLEMDHCQAGFWLTQRWGFPPAYSRVAGCHHDDLPAARNDLVSLTHISCDLADALGFPAVIWSRPATTAEILAQLPADPWWALGFQEEEIKGRIARQIANFEAA
ncbi:MAG TPA: HDOD domain-containing protein [Bryobacteraceae bacterium]|nr:HDOD domain-containing protein [Bryobacteraceae bacterium]